MPQAQSEIAHIQATAQHNNEQTDQRFQRLEQELQQLLKTQNEHAASLQRHAASLQSHTASLQSLRDELSDQKVKLGNREQDFKTLAGYVTWIRVREVAPALASEFDPLDKEEAENATAERTKGENEEEHAV